MPNFVEQLKVPLIALSDSKTQEIIFFKDETFQSHFKNQWKFTDQGFTLNEDYTGVGVPLFEQMEPHEMLKEVQYRPYDFAKDEFAQELVESMDTYHMVETCVPSSVSMEECKDLGYMMVVVGQEIYDHSPFTREIALIMNNDVDEYYLYIILIFCLVKLALFCVLWSWLRMRVTDRMIDLTRKLKTSDSSDKHSYQHKKLTKFDSGSTYNKRNSFSVNQSGVDPHKNSNVSLNQTDATYANVDTDLMSSQTGRRFTSNKSVKGMGRMLDAFTGYQAGRRRDGGTINEIDELEDATDLLFGEQQA